MVSYFSVAEQSWTSGASVAAGEVERTLYEGPSRDRNPVGTWWRGKGPSGREEAGEKLVVHGPCVCCFV
jgi:hypothetical protein